MKKDWIICSGDKYTTHYSHVLLDMTEKEVGQYIKTHVEDLMGHIEMIYGIINFVKSNCVGNALKKYKIMFDGIESLDDYDKFVEVITHELSKIPDKELFNNFYFVEDLTYIRINDYNPHIGERTKQNII